ncbi:ABC transporter substrate-binding protein [Vibrio sp. FNV 38]|nr:ABC transporter substrate-binding protein [Vibrio sp. FNV 38]
MAVQRVITLLLICALYVPSTSLAEQNRVYISQIIDHPALNLVKQGLVDGLIQQGYRQGDNLEIKYEIANGNPTEAAKIARKFVTQHPDVMVGIATPTSQALVASSRTIPIVFTAVTDPIGSRLVKRLNNPGRNVTGLSDLSPISQHMDLMKVLLPEVRQVGVLYNPGEANSVALLERLQHVSHMKGLSIVEAEVLRSSDVKHLAQRLAHEVDVIYAMTDNTIASAISDLISSATKEETPVFAGAVAYVEKGAIAGLGFDYYQIGLQTADYVARILTGEKPGTMPVTVAKGSDLALNDEAAKQLGVKIPQSIRDKVTKLY